MAYNNGFPATYQPMYYTPQYQAVQPSYMQQTQQPAQQNGFVRVQNENEARMYPVAPGSSVTFINENAPYCYTKSVDMSQLDRPKFDKYRLVKEEDTILEPNELQAESKYAVKADVDEEIKKLKEQVANLSAKLNGNTNTAND